MIRGVNKQMIEILNTENEYFEKAILIISDKHFDHNPTELERRAREYVLGITKIQEMRTPPKKLKQCSKKVKLFLSLLKFTAAAATGAILVSLLIK